MNREEKEIERGIREFRETGCARGGRTVRRMWRTGKKSRGGKKAAEMWGGFDGESWQVENRRGGVCRATGREGAGVDREGLEVRRRWRT